MRTIPVDHFRISVLVLMVHFMTILWLSGPSYAQNEEDNSSLFSDKCAGCHTIGQGKLVGPDLASVSSWDDNNLKSAVSRMQSMTGPLTDTEINSLVVFLKSKEASTSLAHRQSSAPDEKDPLKEVFADESIGRALFSGKQRFENGGMSCNACHVVEGVGGTLGPDLTDIAKKMGEKPLLMACEQTGFKVMNATYKDHRVTKQEALHLTKFFMSTADKGTSSISHPPFLLYGVAGAVLMIFFIALAYQNRNSSARSKLSRR